MLTKMALGFTVCVLLALFAPVSAQDAPLASGLNNPRHIVYDKDGNLYIAEAGTAGTTQVQGQYGPAKMGLTGQISVVSKDGKQSVLIPGLISMDSGGQIEGPTSIDVTDTSYWVTLGMGPQNPPENSNTMAVVDYDRQTLTIKQVIDLNAFETQNNPDGGQELVSNPIDLAFDKNGTLYIADASGNSLLTWTEKDGLKLFTAWKVDPTGQTPQVVPTAVAVGPDGDIYVSFLSGYPYNPGTALIERWSPDGKLKESYKGLTLVTDMIITDDGTLYAVEMASRVDDSGFLPNTGRIIQIKNDAVGIVADGLNIPYGIAQTPQGDLAVTVNSTYVPADSGQVVRVKIGTITPIADVTPVITPEVQPGATPEVQPAATPDAQSDKHGSNGGDG